MQKVVLILAALLVTAPAYAQVNRCKDAKTGKVVYSDAACPSGVEAAQIQAPRSAAEIDLERERAALARERHLLEQEKRAVRRSPAAPAEESPSPAPAVARTDSYECRVATRNLGSGINKDSKLQSQQAYERACFGERAADIQKARAGVQPPARNVIILNR